MDLKPWIVPVSALLLAACSGAQDSEALQAQETCAKAVAKYSELYISTYSDHKDPAFDEVLAVAAKNARHVDGPRDDCRTLLGIAKVIRGARPASSRDPFAPEGVALSAVHVIGFILLGFGYLVMAVSGIWLIVVAFRTSVVWGVLYLVVPLASLAFVIMHWEESQTPFLISLAGLAVFGVGFYLVLPYLAGSPEFLEALAS